MSIFKSDKVKLEFQTRAEAFNFMLNYLVSDKGMDPLEASERADKFAEIYASNIGVPVQKEPELKGVDKYISIAEKIGSYLEAHPKILDYGIPALTFVAGLFTGKKVEEHEQPEYQSVREQFENPISKDEIVD